MIGGQISRGLLSMLFGLHTGHCFRDRGYSDAIARRRNNGRVLDLGLHVDGRAAGRGLAGLEDEEGDEAQDEGTSDAQDDADDDGVGIVDDGDAGRRDHYAVSIGGERERRVLAVPGGGLDGRPAVDLGLAIPAVSINLLDVLVKALVLK